MFLFQLQSKQPNPNQQGVGQIAENLFANVKAELAKYYGKDVSNKRVADFLGWLEKNEKTLAALLKEDSASGILSEKKGNEAWFLAGVWLSGMYLASTYCDNRKNECRKLEIGTTTGWRTANKSVMIAKNEIGTRNSSVENFLAGFNGGLHEYAHGLGFISGKRKISLSEFATFTIQGKFALPIKKDFAKTGDWWSVGVRDPRKTMDFVKGGKITSSMYSEKGVDLLREYSAFFFGPWLKKALGSEIDVFCMTYKDGSSAKDDPIMMDDIYRRYPNKDEFYIGCTEKIFSIELPRNSDLPNRKELESKLAMNKINIPKLDVDHIYYGMGPDEKRPIRSKNNDIYEAVNNNRTITFNKMAKLTPGRLCDGAGIWENAYLFRLGGWEKNVESANLAYDAVQGIEKIMDAKEVGSRFEKDPSLKEIEITGLDGKIYIVKRENFWVDGKKEEEQLSVYEKNQYRKDAEKFFEKVLERLEGEKKKNETPTPKQFLKRLIQIMDEEFGKPPLDSIPPGFAEAVSEARGNA